MDFTLTDEQLMFAQSARTLFADRCTAAHRRDMLARGTARDSARWTAIVDMGLTLVLLPEAAGGLGLGETDFALIAEAAGYAGLARAPDRERRGRRTDAGRHRSCGGSARRDGGDDRDPAPGQSLRC